MRVGQGRTRSGRPQGLTLTRSHDAVRLRPGVNDMHLMAFTPSRNWRFANRRCTSNEKPPTMSLLVTTRPAHEDDADFALAVRELTMRQYVEKTWGTWNSAEARKEIDEDIYHRRLRVVEVNRTAAGMIRVDEQETRVHVDQIYLLPEYQNRGIGSGLIRDVQCAARQQGLPVSLWVLRVNPAQRLYERLGFRVVEETNARLRLQSEGLTSAPS